MATASSNTQTLEQSDAISSPNSTTGLNRPGPTLQPWRMMGDVPIASPFTLAALSGYSDLGMRMTCRQLGACFTRHEVLLDQLVLTAKKGPRTGEWLDPGDRPIACQLMGSQPEQMAEAAAKMVPLGYDIIDINFGCPVKKVLGRCRGGFLLSDPTTALEMVQRVIDAVEVPVTVKMRKGHDDNEESDQNFWKILEGAVKLGIVGVAIHGRTVKQRYIGPAKWDRIAQAKKEFPHLVVMGSGDLYTADDCLRMIRQTNCDGVTIARGAIENPWVFRDCLALWNDQPLPPPPTLEEQRDLFDRQYKYAVIQYGPERASRQMRKFGIKRTGLHPRGDELRAAFVKLSSLEEWDALLTEFFP